MPELQIPTIDYGVALQLMVLAGWATILLLLDLFMTNKRVTAYLAIAGLVLMALVGLPQWNTARSTFSGMLILDNYALLLNVLFALIGIISIVLAIDYLPRHGLQRGEYYVLILLAIVGMMLLSQGNDMVIIFLGLEMLSICLYVLVGFAHPRLTSEEAAIKYLLIGAFAAGFLVFGIAMLYGATASSNLLAIHQAIQSPALSPNSHLLLLIGTALSIVGLGYKISIAPFHMWTPDVYQGAPTSVTAFMSVGAKVAGFAALARFLLVALGSQAAVWVPIVGMLAALTMILGNVGALIQSNVKRMLAYSSIGHAGYMLLGILAAGAGAGRGIEALLFYMVAYTLTNLGAFGVLMALEQRGEEAWDMSDLAGLWQRHPWLTVAMTLCMLSLAGVPLTAGFFGKLYVFWAAWESGLWILAVVGVLTSIISAFFYLRVISQMFMQAPSREVSVSLSPNTIFGLGLSAIGIVVLGIIPTPIIDLVQRSVLALGR